MMQAIADWIRYEMALMGTPPAYSYHAGMYTGLKTVLDKLEDVERADKRLLKEAYARLKELDKIVLDWDIECRKYKQEVYHLRMALEDARDTLPWSAVDTIDLITKALEVDVNA